MGIICDFIRFKILIHDVYSLLIHFSHCIDSSILLARNTQRLTDIPFLTVEDIHHHLIDTNAQDKAYCNACKNTETNLLPYHQNKRHDQKCSPCIHRIVPEQQRHHSGPDYNQNPDCL